MAQGSFLLRPTSRTGFEAVEAESDHVFPRHTHEQFGIGVLWRGAQTSFSGRGVVEACAGSVICVNPAEVHDGTPIGEQGRAWKMLYIRPDVMSEVIGDIRERVGSYELRHPVLSSPSAAQAMQRLYAELTSAVSDDLLRDSLLTAVLAVLVTEKPVTNSCSAADVIRRAQEMIDDDPARDFPLAELARICGMSRFQTLRHFARRTGLTPHAYRMQKRIDLARRLIRRGQKLAEVAAESGFADQSHMTRAFVARYGLTPGMFAAAA